MAISENIPQVALIGNPNVGKSTLFNKLTGMNQHTGNWTGKTVGVATGQYRYKGKEYEIADLPGTYSLLGNSAEEEIAIDYIRSDDDCIVVIVCDGTCLERNLNLVLQIMEIHSKLIVCVNLLDEAKKKDISLDLMQLEKKIGVPVVGTSATTALGLDDLKDAIRNMTDGFSQSNPIPTIFSAEITNDGTTLFDANHKDSDLITETFVKRAAQIALEMGGENTGYTRKEAKLDKIITGGWTAFPIMLVLLTAVFWLTIKGANYPSAMLQSGFDWIGVELRHIFTMWNMPYGIISLLLDGIWTTVAQVIAVMLPPMVIFFPLFALLEDLGYLPRLAYVLDNNFAKCGACGKQSLTMAMGFGCNAVGVVGCRIIDSPRERIIAIITNALVPCNGRFPTLIVLITIFFADSAHGLLSSLILTGFVVLGVVMTFVASWILSKTVLKGIPSSFTLELPPFRKPQVGQLIVRSMLDRVIFVLGRAILVAIPAGIVLWILCNVSVGETTLMISFVSWLEPAGLFLGMSGAILAAFILGFPANELVVPIIIMILSGASVMGGDSTVTDTALLMANSGWTWKTALCTMVFVLFHWPCSTTCLTIHKETHSIKWTLLAFFIPSFIGIVFCSILNLILS